MRIIAAPVIELGSVGLSMSGGSLNIFKGAAILQHGGDKRCSHRMRRISPNDPYRLCVLPEHAVDSVGVHVPAFFLPLAIETIREIFAESCKSVLPMTRARR